MNISLIGKTVDWLKLVLKLNKHCYQNVMHAETGNQVKKSALEEWIPEWKVGMFQ